jgi:ferredoxin
MKRKIIKIDENKCDGCGQCITACHEGALALIRGKAQLVKDTFCDGLGACIGECPQGALTIVERDAPEFDEAAVAAGRRSDRLPLNRGTTPAHSCPGSAMRSFEPERAAPSAMDQPPQSSLGHWPVQLMLVPPHAPFLQGADLLVCADCVPFAVPDFHARYLSGRAVVVGCPKLDDLSHYAQKLVEIVQQAQPRRLTVARMEVPCCRGIAQAAIQAALGSNSPFRIEEHVVGIRGSIERRTVR